MAKKRSAKNSTTRPVDDVRSYLNSAGQGGWMAYHRILAVVGFVLVLGVAPSAQTAELSPINFVSSGSGGIVEVLRFSLKQGFFKKQGLDVTMIYVPSGVLAAQTVVSGSALIANNSVSDILNAIAAGAPLKILTVNIDRFQHLFVARPGIHSPKDMKGKKVAVSRYGAFSDIETRFLIRQWGMDPDRDVQVLQIGNSAARSAALMSGGIDGAVVTPAFVPVARNAGLNVIFDLSTIKTRFANIGLMAQERLIREQPRLVKGAVAGLVHGIKFWKTNPEVAKAYLKQIHKVSAADLDSIYEDGSKNIRSEPTPDLDGIQTAWESIPDLKARGPVDFKKFVDSRFIEEVLREMK
jgi:NitT/TauT family transport system substrate-binding protein